MNVVLVSIYDSASKAYDAPRAVPSVGVAKRQLTDIVRDQSQPSVPFRDHAEHFSLFEVGSFDSETGSIVSFAPKLIANLWELKLPVMQD